MDYPQYPDHGVFFIRRDPDNPSVISQDLFSLSIDETRFKTHQFVVIIQPERLNDEMYKFTS